STRPCAAAISSRVPPGDSATPASRQIATLSRSARLTYAVPQPSLIMSTCSPAATSSDSSASGERPRSSTCLIPARRGLSVRSGRSRKAGVSCTPQSMAGRAAPPGLRYDRPGADMRIDVRLGSGLARLAGGARLSVDVAEGATVGDVLARVGEERPALAGGLAAA